MLDFLRVTAVPKKDYTEVKPKFICSPLPKDLMIRGGDFYAVWDETKNLWSKNEDTVHRQVDAAIEAFSASYSAAHPGETLYPLYMWDSDSGSVDRWHKYVKNQLRDTFVELDEKLVFSNQTVEKTDYVSKTLPYPLEEGDISAYEELIGTLYSPEEKEKLEWAVGSIISGDSKKLQKFIVLYGDKGTGKSTVLDIIANLFGGFDENGFCAPFNAKDLGLSSRQFALEPFRDNPLVAIQHDGDLSKIEDNTRLNSLVSHEIVSMNTKHEKAYPKRVKSFLFLGTNTPVKITDAKSGILRRLIDVRPTGNKVSARKYDELTSQIKFELGAIAYHCLDVYKTLGKHYYDSYIPREMMAETNEFYGYIEYIYDYLMKEDSITLSDAWARYKDYCEFAGCRPMTYLAMRTELRNYFHEFYDRKSVGGKQLRNLYSGFRSDKMHSSEKVKTLRAKSVPDWLNLVDIETSSRFDEIFADSIAQYATPNGKPYKDWSLVKTHLKDLDTHKEHYVKPSDEKLICADFDLRDKDGNKCLSKNIDAAAKWPKTYAEVSKSGGGLHLYYFYTGDISQLSSVFGEGIEIKTFPKDKWATLRRRVSKCNNYDIATINSGLPLKEERKVINWAGYKDEKHLKNVLVKEIRANINKEHKGNTAESINLIKKILDDAYESGLPYDVEELRQSVILFALNASNSKDRCLKVIEEMHFTSKEEMPEGVPLEGELPYDERPIVFFDCEVYKNLFVIVWKYEGTPDCVDMVNPLPKDVAYLLDNFRLIGFNCRNYDNIILYARASGYSNMQLYKLSQDIINSHSGVKIPFANSAKNLSYTDVFDYCTEKMSLKKWEYRLGEEVEHEEMDIPWDAEVPEDRIADVVHYCENDVRATEAVHKARQGDFMARKIQVDLVHLMHGDDIPVTVNDTTNTLSKRIIFGKNKAPQVEFNYRDMSKPVGAEEYEYYRAHFGDDYKFRVFDAEGLPLYRDFVPGEKLPAGYSILPFFPGYDFDIKRGKDKSIYLNEVIGEGGRVYSVRGYYEWVWDGDISSQHPHSIIAEVLFGPKYTKIFEEIVKARVAVKHKDFETAGKLLGGALKPYLKEELAGDLAQALKIVINSIYGLTKASFDNEFRDKRNVDNIVAKRGALFMTLLKKEVERRGYMVCHIKTDSIKIPRADDDIKDFVIKFGREFGYEFETEAEFAKFCLFNDAAYVGWDTITNSWVTKADQFKKEKQPFLFKTLFSHEPYDISDYCEAKSCSKGYLYLDMNEGLPDVSEKEKTLAKVAKKLKKQGMAVEDRLLVDSDDGELQALKEEIRKGHNLVFIGRVGEFTPIKPGYGGGVLYRVEDGRFYAATGSSGYRWLQSSTVRKYGMEDAIDKSFYTALVDEARKDINDLVDLDFFLSDDLPEKKLGADPHLAVPDFMNIPADAPEEIPWD